MVGAEAAVLDGVGTINAPDGTVLFELDVSYDTEASLSHCVRYEQTEATGAITCADNGSITLTGSLSIQIIDEQGFTSFERLVIDPELGAGSFLPDDRNTDPLAPDGLFSSDFITDSQVTTGPISNLVVDQVLRDTVSGRALGGLIQAVPSGSTFSFTIEGLGDALTPVPAPGAALLVGTGLAVAGSVRRRAAQGQNKG